jgi:tryptophan 2,3-dioxygenase
MQSTERPPVYYSEYLQLHKILDAQAPESLKEGIKADDELLFIIIHQTYELWFKQILHEVNLVREVFKSSTIDDNGAYLYNAVHKLKRVVSILEVLVQQISVLETMTALDFLDFRDLLRPASGFQSIQFKQIEAALGLEFKNRYGKEYYTSQLTSDDVARVKDVEAQESLLSLINKWLERMPFLEQDHYWKDFNAENKPVPVFYQYYKEAYEKSLTPAEESQKEIFESLFLNPNKYPEERKLSQLASRNALFIFLYRDYPRMQLPFEFLDTLLEIDGLMGLWRYRHIHMVQRTIGKRVGTGGSSGVHYLKKAADSHYIFNEFSELTSYMLARKDLPQLPEGLIQDLSYKKSH